MDNMIWIYFKNLIYESHINNLNIEIPADDSLADFLFNRETSDFLLSYSLTSLPVLKAKKYFEQSKERGLHCLYIGYLYVNLHLQENTFLYEPLILFPVNITAKNNSWYLTNNNKINIMLNYRLIFHYYEKNQMSYNCFLKELTDLSNFNGDKMAGILAHLEKNDFFITNEHIQYIDKKAGLFILPSSFSMFRDYEIILSGEKNSRLCDSLINISLKQSQKPVIDYASYSDLYQVSSLNSSQSHAAAASGILDQALIIGPKGNGKKETILNIISDNLANRKNVLVISENRETLLDLYEKLSRIRNKVCLLTGNEDDIYDKIEIQIKYKSEKQNDKILNQIVNKSENINKKIKVLEDLEQVLYKKRSFGLSLQEMYSMTSAIKGREDYRYEAFKTFQSKKPFKMYTYNQLNASAEVLSKFQASDYEDYRSLIEDYPWLLKIKPEAEPFEIENICKNEKEIISAFINIYNNIKHMENFSDVALLNLSKDFNVSRQDILYTAENILRISEKSVSLPQNRLFNFIRQKNRKIVKSIKSPYEDLPEVLFAYNDMTAGYMKVISDLKEIMNNDFYADLIETAFRGADMADYLKTLFETLKKFNIFKRYSDIISGLNDLDRLILSYTYENNQPPLNQTTLIDHILEFSVLSQIKDIESCNSDKKSLFTCLKYSELKDSIYNCKAEKKQLIWDFINQVWDSMLSEIIYSGEYINLMEQISKRQFSLKNLFTKENKTLLTLFPVILAAPENVSDVLPLDNTFSLIIYADACQISVSKAIPSLFRGNKLTVCGDVMSVVKNDSLLNKCSDRYYNAFLNYCYTPEKEDILSYQNKNFYHNSIIISPDLRSISEKKPGIELINIENAVNKICKIIMEGSLSKIGITVFCEKDKENINKYLVKREIYINKNYIYSAKESLLNERDTVFIFTSGFSSISDKYKYNMLNMALSSARRKVYLVYEDNRDALVNEYIDYAADCKKPADALSGNKKWLFNKLKSLGYNISCGLGYPAAIDIGIKDKSGRYILGIIFDKESLYPLSKIKYYESMGWKIYRVWSRDLWLDKASVLSSIIKAAGPFLK